MYLKGKLLDVQSQFGQTFEQLNEEFGRKTSISLPCLAYEFSDGSKMEIQTFCDPFVPLKDFEFWGEPDVLQNNPDTDLCELFDNKGGRFWAELLIENVPFPVYFENQGNLNLSKYRFTSCEYVSIEKEMDKNDMDFFFNDYKSELDKINDYVGNSIEVTNGSKSFTVHEIDRVANMTFHKDGRIEFNGQKGRLEEGHHLLPNIIGRDDDNFLQFPERENSQVTLLIRGFIGSKVKSGSPEGEEIRLHHRGQDRWTRKS